MNDLQAGLHLSEAACHALCDALPRTRTLAAAMQAVERVRQAALGDGLLTVSLNLSVQELPPSDGGIAADIDSLTLQRVWTSNPEAYPVAGRKRKTLTPWTRQLLLGAQVFVGEGDAVLREVFHDHALIASLGLRSVVNIPLLDAQGRCFATFNALGPRPQWAPENVWLLRLLATLATPAVQRSAQALEPLPA